MNDNFDSVLYGDVYLGLLCSGVAAVVILIIVLCTSSDRSRQNQLFPYVFLTLGILNVLLFTWSLIFLYGLYHSQYVLIPESIYWFESASRDRNINTDDKSSDDTIIT